ncbi:MAG: ATP-binding protein [Gemmatimonadota bacterium]
MSAPSIKPTDITDRDREWAILQSLWGSSSPELVFVVGRRRVGKSFLLGRFAREARGLYYQATRRTEAEQLAQLSRAVGEHFADSALQQGVAFPDWEALFAYIAGRVAGEPFLLVLDEFPYLADAAPALTSILQAWWDHRWVGTRMKLVLCGSHITAMRRLEAADQPLYGRRTRRMVLHPFTPRDVGAFVPRYDARDVLTAYGLFGGLPGHLSLLDPARSLAANAATLLLDSSGRLADEAQHMLDAFLGDAAVHYSILEAVATGDQTWKGITNRIGRSGGAALRPLDWLVGMLILERVVPISERDPRKSKRALYRIADPYVGFWHRFVAPLAASGAIGLVPPERLWSTSVSPQVADYMGPVFEDVCRQAVRSGRVQMPFELARVGEWWNSSSTEQIDVVVLGGTREMFIAECKWGRVTSDDLERLERRGQLIAGEIGGVRRTHVAVFSGSNTFDAGVTRAIESGRILGYSANHLI